MNGWMDAWMDGWMDGWMDAWMDGWMDGWMDEWMNDKLNLTTVNSSGLKIIEHKCHLDRSSQELIAASPEDPKGVRLPQLNGKAIPKKCSRLVFTCHWCLLKRNGRYCYTQAFSGAFLVYEQLKLRRLATLKLGFWVAGRCPLNTKVFLSVPLLVANPPIPTFGCCLMPRHRYPVIPFLP